MVVSLQLQLDLFLPFSYLSWKVTLIVEFLEAKICRRRLPRFKDRKGHLSTTDRAHPSDLMPIMPLSAWGERGAFELS